MPRAKPDHVIRGSVRETVAMVDWSALILSTLEALRDGRFHPRGRGDDDRGAPPLLSPRL